MVHLLVSSLHAKHPELFSQDTPIAASSSNAAQYLSDIFSGLPSLVVYFLKRILTKIAFADKLWAALSQLRASPSERVEVDPLSALIADMIPTEPAKSDLKLPMACVVTTITLMLI